VRGNNEFGIKLEDIILCSARKKERKNTKMQKKRITTK